MYALKIAEAKKAVKPYIARLNRKLKRMTCGINVFTACNLFAPKCWETIEEIAVFVCATIQIIAERNEPTIPAAASASIGCSFTLPITAISVSEISGSAIPAIIAGIARRLIFLKLTEVFKIGFDGTNVS